MPANVSVSTAEKAFALEWEKNGFPGSDIVQQYRFHPERLWRFDFAFPSLLVAVEIQGCGRTAPTYCGKCKTVCRCPRCQRIVPAAQAGGHQTPKGMREDSHKHTAALLAGWRVLFFPTSDYDPPRWVETTKDMLILAAKTQATPVLTKEAPIKTRRQASSASQEALRRILSRKS